MYNISDRLTLTWDVLKLAYSAKRQRHYLRLTLTWDVLKCFYPTIKVDTCPINFNMGCFEMIIAQKCNGAVCD